MFGAYPTINHSFLSSAPCENAFLAYALLFHNASGSACVALFGGGTINSGDFILPGLLLSLVDPVILRCIVNRVGRGSVR